LVVFVVIGSNSSGLLRVLRVGDGEEGHPPTTSVANSARAHRRQTKCGGGIIHKHIWGYGGKLDGGALAIAMGIDANVEENRKNGAARATPHGGTGGAPGRSSRA
jgi:hypothetical protein